MVPLPDLVQVFFQLLLLVGKRVVEVLLVGEVALQPGDFHISVSNVLLLLINFLVERRVGLVSLSQSQLAVIYLSSDGGNGD